MMTSPTPPSQNAGSGGMVGAADAVSLALGRIPSGLFVISWRSDDTDRGMLASWVMQAGFEPPSLTVAVARARDLLAAVHAGSHFVVNVLAESQRPLLGRFGKPGDEPFAGLEVGRTPSGIATLPETAGWLECLPLPDAIGEAGPGDHVVVRGTVIAAGCGGERQPLVHVRKNGLRY